MIILTGGAGFIGSCFLWKLNKEGIKDILVVDHLDRSEKWKNLVGKKFYNYIQKDDFLNSVISRQIRRPHAIIHFGACSSTTLCNADYYIKNNYEYSKTLALWAFELDVPFIYASSAATYGSCRRDCGSASKIEDLVPLNIYGFSKHMFDLWLFNNNYLEKVIGIKFFNVFGPNEYHKDNMCSVICKSYHDVVDKGLIKLFKSYDKNYVDGEQRRDFVYIKDVVNVVYFLFRNPSSSSGIFDLGTGKSRTWNDVAKFMFTVIGRSTNIEYIEMPDDLKPNYQYFTQAKINNLRKAGYSAAFMELEDSVKDYCSYLRNKSYL
jgi:ADP-L-glycero-D-manno-heptose 6-epimerase